MESFLLAGDIGGTKTTLAIVDPKKGPRSYLAKATYPSGNYSTFADLLDEFLKGDILNLTRASFGVAGPIFEGKVQMSNLPWHIDESQISEKLKIPVQLLNDIIAIAHAVPILNSDDLETLSFGKTVDHDPIAVIAPGTGLGEAYLHWNGTGYIFCPSEGGHVDFAPINKIQVELLQYMQDRFEHVSYERVCSGPGLFNLYTFLRDSGEYPEPEWLREQILAVADPTPVITQAALEGRAEIAMASLKLFVSILGNEAGNLALKVLARGGVYLGGGIPPRIISFLKDDLFMDSFVHKGRFSSLLENIPVYIIHNPEAALIGASYNGIMQEKNN